MEKINNCGKRHVDDGFFVRHGERQEKCYYAEILYVEASGCYSYIYRKDRPHLTVTYPLGVVERYLPREMFVRVHRGYIVNLYHVKGFIGKAMCVANEVLPVSPSYREEVFACFDFWDSARRESGRMREEDEK